MNLRNNITLLFTLLMISASISAAPNNQAISISADRVTIDEKSGNSTYKGNVILKQGEIAITAEMISISSANGEVSKIISTGKPSKFVRTGEASLEAESKQMTYLSASGVITLTGEARLNRQGDEFTSHQIRYFIDENRVEASSGEGNSQSSGRVQVILQPQSGNKR